MINLKLDFAPMQKNLKKLFSINRIERAVKVANRVVMAQIKKDADKKTPVDTRELIDSWREEERGMVRTGGYDIEYAQYQHEGMREDGTHFIRNRPAGGETYWLQNTIDNNLPKYCQLYKEIFFTELLK